MKFRDLGKIGLAGQIVGQAARIRHAQRLMQSGIAQIGIDQQHPRATLSGQGREAQRHGALALARQGGGDQHAAPGRDVLRLAGQRQRGAQAAKRLGIRIVRLFQRQFVRRLPGQLPLAQRRQHRQHRQAGFRLQRLRPVEIPAATAGKPGSQQPGGQSHRRRQQPATPARRRFRLAWQGGGRHQPRIEALLGALRQFAFIGPGQHRLVELGAGAQLLLQGTDGRFRLILAFDQRGQPLDLKLQRALTHARHLGLILQAGNNLAHFLRDGAAQLLQLRLCLPEARMLLPVLGAQLGDAALDHRLLQAQFAHQLGVQHDGRTVDGAGPVEQAAHLLGAGLRLGALRHGSDKLGADLAKLVALQRAVANLDHAGAAAIFFKSPGAFQHVGTQGVQFLAEPASGPFGGAVAAGQPAVEIELRRQIRRARRQPRIGGGEAHRQQPGAVGRRDAQPVEIGIGRTVLRIGEIGRGRCRVHQPGQCLTDQRDRLVGPAQRQGAPALQKRRITGQPQLLHGLAGKRAGAQQTRLGQQDGAVDTARAALRTVTRLQHQHRLGAIARRLGQDKAGRQREDYQRHADQQPLAPADCRGKTGLRGRRPGLAHAVRNNRR